MPLARINGRLLHFVHIPKTGGSSINSYLRSVGQLGLYSRTPVDWMRISPQHLHRKAFRAVMPDGLCDCVFTVLRDPRGRLISEYRYRAARWAELSGSRDDNAVEWQDGTCFRGDFDAWVMATFRAWLDDPCLYDNHIRPQTDFWHPGMTSFLFEDGLSRVFDWIDTQAGLSGTAPRVHENPGAPVPVRVSPDTDALIREFYRNDFLLIDRMKKAGAVRSDPGPQSVLSRPADVPRTSASAK